MYILCLVFSKHVPQVSLVTIALSLLFSAPFAKTPPRRLRFFLHSQRRRKKRRAPQTHTYPFSSMCVYIFLQNQKRTNVHESARGRSIFRLCAAIKVLRDNLFDCRKVRRTLLQAEMPMCAKIKFSKVLCACGIHKMKFRPTACGFFEWKVLLISAGWFHFLAPLNFNSLNASH